MMMAVAMIAIVPNRALTEDYGFLARFLMAVMAIFFGGGTAFDFIVMMNRDMECSAEHGLGEAYDHQSDHSKSDERILQAPPHANTIGKFSTEDKVFLDAAVSRLQKTRKTHGLRLIPGGSFLPTFAGYICRQIPTNHPHQSKYDPVQQMGLPKHEVQDCYNF